jgi:hypothetical protein
MVITVIRLVPGAMGVIDIAPGGEQPPTPGDLTGYWDFFWTPEGQDQIGPMQFYIRQTGSELQCSTGFSGTIEGSAVALEAWVDMEGGPYHVFLNGTVSGDQISGSVTGDLGEGTFLFVPSTMPFGRLDLEGTVEGVPVSLHTDYALGSDGVMETSSQYGFSLDIGSLAGTLQFTGVGESAGTFAVAEEAHEQDQVQVTLWAEGAEYQASGGEVVVNQNDESGMSGSFDVSFVEMPF